MKDIKHIKAKVHKTDSRYVGDHFVTTKTSPRGKREAKSKVKNLDQENQKLRNTVNDLEQYSRKDNVIMHGVPFIKEEDIVGIVETFATALDIMLYDYDTNSAHHLPAHKDKIPAIIVRLNSRFKKSVLIENSTKKRLPGKDLKFDPAVPIFVNEHLTSHTAHIRKKVLELKRKNGIHQAWVKDGKVCICKSEGDRPIKIIDIVQLEK